MTLAIDIVGGWLALNGLVFCAWVGCVEWQRLKQRRRNKRRGGYVAIGPPGRRRLP